MLGFTELCKLLLVNRELEIIPAMINSDIIENMFCQQRSTYNGANSNPNALQYRNNINSIILGQKLVSNKGNAGKSMIKSPNLYCGKKSVSLSKYPLPHSSSLEEYSRLKVIKM